jgi:hypothetical protein
LHADSSELSFVTPLAIQLHTEGLPADCRAGMIDDRRGSYQLAANRLCVGIGGTAQKEGSDHRSGKLLNTEFHIHFNRGFFSEGETLRRQLRVRLGSNATLTFHVRLSEPFS